jgi:hypothetical protein
MKSLGHQSGGGSFNLKGKLTHGMTCLCCVMVNFKQKILKKEHKKEVNFYKREVDKIQ